MEIAQQKIAIVVMTKVMVQVVNVLNVDIQYRQEKLIITVFAQLDIMKGLTMNALNVWEFV